MELMLISAFNSRFLNTAINLLLKQTAFTLMAQMHFDFSFFEKAMEDWRIKMVAYRKTDDYSKDLK